MPRVNSLQYSLTSPSSTQEESYLHFAASALAGIGLVRNLFGCVFPLFGRQM